ncbi:MAG: GNAT family N-acetyltransferase [Thermomicrobiales bacterium]
MTETVSEPTTQPGSGHQEQTFLIGDEIYLRPPEEADAKSTVSWRPTVFPISVMRTTEWIKETLAKQNPFREITLLIVRKLDDVVVGSISASYADVCSEVNAHVDPLFGERGQRWTAEAILLVMQWAVDERRTASGLVELPANEEIVINALENGGMRQAARFREWYLRKGVRVDKISLEYLNQSWVTTLGDPNELDMPRTGTGEPRPVPEKVAPVNDPPRNAVLIGKRVYLRPTTRADSEAIARHALRETETFFDIGRHLPDIEGFAAWNENNQKEPFPNWIRFAVCLRENDELIGEVGMFGVDYVSRTAETASFFHRPEYRGGGFGSEAKQLLLEYAFEKLGLHVVQSWVYFSNTRSAAALRKQGYRESGRINRCYPHEGTFSNFVTFDLLASEWRAMPRAEWK